VRRAKEHVH
jgi:hypothetical protein